MPASKQSTRPKVKSDMAKVDAHVIQPHEYDELPELTDEMLSTGRWYKNGRPIPPPRQAISIRLPIDVIARWRATGRGWQTRMAKRLEKVR